MKKIIILSFLLAVSVSLMAQRSGSTTVLLPQQNLKTLSMTSADTVTHSGTSYWVFDIGNRKLQYFAVSVACDTVAHANVHVYFDVLGSMDGTKYIATSATQVKFGATMDSTFVLADVSTGVLWRYLKLQAAGKSTSIKGPRVTGISLKIADK